MDYPKTTDNNSHFNGSAFGNTTLTGGDVIIYDGGDHTQTQYFNDYHGAVFNPIIIFLNGQDVDVQSWNVGINLVNCSYIKVIGGTVRNALTNNLNSISSWAIDISFMNFYNSGSTSVRGGFESNSSSTKTQANFIDPFFNTTWCTIDGTGTGGEGLYGCTSNSHVPYVDDNGNVYFKSYTEKVTFAYNKISNTQLDGLQVGACRGFASIHDNVIFNYGEQNKADHASGIQMGVGTRGECYNNLVFNSLAIDKGAAFALQGCGIDFHHNTAFNVYDGAWLFETFPEHNRETLCYNNTFVNCRNRCIYINARPLRNIEIHNNIFHLTNPPVANEYIDVYLAPNYVESNNITCHGASGLTDLDFTNYDQTPYDDQSESFDEYTTRMLAQDFSVSNTSIAFGAGLNLSHYSSKAVNSFSNEIMNISNYYHPFTGSWDAGAVTLNPSATISAIDINGAIEITTPAISFNYTLNSESIIISSGLETPLVNVISHLTVDNITLSLEIESPIIDSIANINISEIEVYSFITPPVVSFEYGLAVNGLNIFTDDPKPTAFFGDNFSGYLLTEQDFRSRMRQELISVIDRDDEGFLFDAVKAAEGEAKGYLNLYNIDALFTAHGDARDSTLVMYLKDMALWHFVALANPNINIEFTETRYENAIKWFKGIQKGATVPHNWPSAITPESATKLYSGSNIERRKTSY